MREDGLLEKTRVVEQLERDFAANMIEQVGSTVVKWVK